MKKIYILLITLLLIITSQPSLSEIYKYTDNHGNIQFTDKKPQEDTEIKKVKLKYNKERKLDTADKIIIYSASWCGVCKTAKGYFNSQGIPFKEYDIEKSTKGRKDFKQLRGRGVPIILIGKHRMDGFDRAYFERLYEG